MNLFRAFLLTILFSISTLSFAQTGSIKGMVLDEADGSELIGVSVIIEGTKIGTVTDFEGKFQISNLQPGKYNVVFNYISYSKKILNGIEVKAGEVNDIKTIVLAEATKELTEAVVRAEIKKETTVGMLLQQKKNVSISDGLSADVIKRTPDATTGDVMKRVSGTSIQDNKFAIIRGLNDRYNTAYINGAPLPSSESDRKAFSFDIIPSAMLDNIVITKSASADLPGDFAGGLITINTKDIPEKKFISFGTSVSYHSISTGKTSVNYDGGSMDWLGFDNGTRKLPDGLAPRLEYEQQTNEQKFASSSKFNDNWQTNRKNAPINHSYNFSFGNTYNFGKEKKNQFGLIGSTSYGHSNRFTQVERNRFNKPMTTQENQHISNYTDSVFKEEIMFANMLNMAVKLNNNHKIAFKNAFTVNTEDQTILRGGFDNLVDQEFMPLVKNTYFIYQENKLYTGQLIGDHYLNASEIKLNWILNTNYIKRDMPDFRRFSTRSVMLDQNTGEYSAYAAQIGPNIDITQVGRFYSTLNENINSAAFNFKKMFKTEGKKFTTELKAGAFAQMRSREFQARVFGYKIRQVINPSSKYNYQTFITQDLSEIFKASNFAPDTFYIDERINPQDVYDANSKLGAAYIMADQRLKLRTRISYGLRYEVFNQQLNSKGAAGEPVKVNTTKHDFMPSANITYELTKQMNLRASASRSVARPEFRELAPFAFYDFNINSVVAGNPNLKRTSIQNYDLRYEYYPGEGQLMSVSLFYKKFTNAIENVYEFIGSDATLGFTSDANANNYGFEVEIRKSLDFLDKPLHTKWLNKMSFTCNFAWIKSEIVFGENTVLKDFGTRPLQGQSPYILNTSLQYFDEKKDLSFALFVNRVGRRIAYAREKNGLVPDLWENPRTVMDLTASKKIGKKLDVKLTWGDILHQDLVFYQDNNDNKKYDLITNEARTKADISQKVKMDNAMFTYKMGWNFGFGVSYKF